PKGAPQFYVDLMMRCWDDDPCQRPSAKDLYDNIKFWWLDAEKFRLLDEFNNSVNSESYCNLKIHPEAIYKSRFISYVHCQEDASADEQ
ncbi:7299_t:CDS:1, partial [Acaulospora morrowiae]